MQKRTIVTIWFLVLLLVGGALLGACGGRTPTSAPATTAPAATDAPAQAAPAIDAAALLQARCVGCHDLSRVTGARNTQEQWQTVVTQMIQKGAVLNPDEEAALVAYLAETYKP